VDALMAMMIKRANLDNAPLQELVPNNVEEVDVNYIKKFNNNAYGNNNNSGYPTPPFAQNTYGSWPTCLPNTTYASGKNVLNELESTIRSFITTKKEPKNEFIAKFENMDALCEKVDNLAKEFTALKNFVQPQRSHEETMKYLE
jgi:hypothetical protein